MFVDIKGYVALDPTAVLWFQGQYQRRETATK
jgi:hypothetical protein